MGGDAPALAPASRTAEAVVRRSYGRLVALLARRTRDIAAAEDALSDALAEALAHWPERGVPANPEAWLLTVARRKSIDSARRRRSAEAAEGNLRWLGEELAAARSEGPEPLDERLLLMFACAHPAIDPAIRAPLILQTILGFDAATIASAFLVSPATMSQRLVRAKRKISDSGIPFERPESGELALRLDAVLDAIYATFSEGWADPAGADTQRSDVAEEAVFLARLVVSQLPGSAETLGLLSLMLHALARREARRSPVGDYVPLASQDPNAWDQTMIDEAESLLARASALPETGRYQLEAAIQSAHAIRRFRGEADWQAIAKIYDALLALTDSPAVAVNRAVAIAECETPQAGVEALDAIGDDPRLRTYQPYWAARAELLARRGDPGDARHADAAYEQAIGLATDAAIRQFLEARRAELAPIADAGDEGDEQ